MSCVDDYDDDFQVSVKGGGGSGGGGGNGRKSNNKSEKGHHNSRAVKKLNTAHSSDHPTIYSSKHIRRVEEIRSKGVH
jgi:hypothetical protein